MRMRPQRLPEKKLRRVTSSLSLTSAALCVTHLPSNENSSNALSPTKKSMVPYRNPQLCVIGVIHRRNQSCNQVDGPFRRWMP